MMGGSGVLGCIFRGVEYGVLLYNASNVDAPMVADKNSVRNASENLDAATVAAGSETRTKAHRCFPPEISPQR